MAVIVLAGVILTFALSQFLAAGPSDSSGSPYPAQLALQRGLTMSNIAPAPPWGTVLSSSQARSVTIKSTGPSFEWGVWMEAGHAGQYPVRSTDGGARWTTAGPTLASDWAGGSLYYVGKLIPEGPSAVVMVSNAIIDVTTDAGRHWFQYLNTAANWSISGHTSVGGDISIRVSGASWAYLPKASFAIYVLDLSHLQWRRVAQSLASVIVPACQSKELSIHGGRQGAPFHSVEGSVVVVNTSNNRCVIRVDAPITLFQRDGVRLDVHEQVPNTSTPSMVLPAKGSTTLVLGWSNWCHANPGPLTISIPLAGDNGAVAGPFNGPPNYNAVPGCINRALSSELNLVTP
jgi:hypothetical protein